MKEKLIDIVKDIDSCAKARKGTRVIPIARAHCMFDGSADTYWLCSDYYSAHDVPHLREYGHFVPKNSSVAIKIQTSDAGDSFDYKVRLNKYDCLSHHVELENFSDFQNRTISIAGDSLLYQFRDIGEFLDTLRKNREDILDIEAQIEEHRQTLELLKKQKDTAAQRGQITRTINELQKEYRILTLQQEDLKNITIYIRKQGEMRYSLIVDAIQTRIKSQNLFDGTTVVINGGPGTGKTTTMIHRLAYLTDVFAIDEDEDKKIFSFKLDSRQRRLLREAIQSQRDWVFFSPSQMLKEYLAEAMRKEGLSNTSQKVCNWKDYCRLVLKVNYNLLGDENSKAPFRPCFLTGTLFYQGSDIINEFERFYLNQLRTIKNQLPQLNSDGVVHAWTVIAQNIEKRFADVDTFDLGKFVSLFNSLEATYGNHCKDLLREKNVVISDLAWQICGLLDEHQDVKSELEDLMGTAVEDSGSIYEEDAVEPVLEGKETSGGEKQINSLEAGISSKSGDDTEERSKSKTLPVVESWLKSYCFSRVNQDASMTDEERLISEDLLPLLGNQFDSQFQKIGELMLFEQYAQYTRGVKAIMLNGMPARYKKFRQHLMKTQFSGCDLKLLRDVMQRSQGRELHHQEQSLLLGFINTLVKQIKRSTSTRIKHVFVDAYDEVCRPIIGIDEATDFSACDIYAMQSLLSLEFNSLTLCGDMMQRLTSYGIKSWEELNGIIPNPVIVEMKTSYRQSKKLLDVARELYQDTLGETPSYKPFMKSNKVPAPLACIDGNEIAKIQWISARISEVFRAYGDQLPSIAIFVNDKGYIPNFSERLQNTEFFTKNGFKVLDGTANTSKTEGRHICVYPIEVVKGMEFDVVFFHNIDNSSVDTEMLKRYIYVGVSRAAFFLGITMSERNEEICKYFEKNKDWFKI